MQVTRTTAIRVSEREVRQALKMLFPDVPVIQAMPDVAGGVKIEPQAVGGLLLTFQHTPGENAPVADSATSGPDSAA